MSKRTYAVRRPIRRDFIVARLLPSESDLIRAAAAVQGVALSELLRAATLAAAREILRGAAGRPS